MAVQQFGSILRRRQAQLAGQDEVPEPEGQPGHDAKHGGQVAIGEEGGRVGPQHLPATAGGGGGAAKQLTSNEVLGGKFSLGLSLCSLAINHAFLFL